MPVAAESAAKQLKKNYCIMGLLVFFVFQLLTTEKRAAFQEYSVVCGSDSTPE